MRTKQAENVRLCWKTFCMMAVFLVSSALILLIPAVHSEAARNFTVPNAKSGEAKSVSRESDKNLEDLMHQVTYLMTTRSLRNEIDIKYLSTPENNTAEQESGKGKRTNPRDVEFVALEKALRALEQEKSHYDLLDRDLAQFKIYLRELMEAKDKEVNAAEQILELRSEIDQLRSDVAKVKTELSACQQSFAIKPNTSQLVDTHAKTIEWLKLTVGELRSELLEVARENNISISLQRHQDTMRNIQMLVKDVQAVSSLAENLKIVQMQIEATTSQTLETLAEMRHEQNDLSWNVSRISYELSYWINQFFPNVSSSVNQSEIHDSLDHTTEIQLEEDITSRIQEEIVDRELFSSPSRRIRHRSDFVEVLHVKSIVKLLLKKIEELELSQTLLKTNMSTAHSRLDRQRKINNELEAVLKDDREKLATLSVAYDQMHPRLDKMEETLLLNTNELTNLSSVIMGLEKLHESTLKLFRFLEELEDRIDADITGLKAEMVKLNFNSVQFSTSLDIIKQDQKDTSDSLKETRKELVLYRDRQQNDHLRLITVHNQLLNQSLQTCKHDNSVMMQEVKLSIFDKKLGNFLQELHDVNRSLENLHTTLSKKVDIVKFREAAYLSHDLLSLFPAVHRQLHNITIASNILLQSLPKDCYDASSFIPGLNFPAELPIYPWIKKSILNESVSLPVKVWCDRDTQNRSWTLIQRRKDGTENFFRNWTDYVSGFGSPENEHWIGLEILHQLTSSRPYVIRFDLWDKDECYTYAQYDYFRIAPESDNYRLNIGKYSGNATNALAHHVGMQFSTPDRDHDSSSTHCAQYYLGGWWYGHCQHANLNGRYGVALTWYNVELHQWIQLKKVEIKIIPL